MSKLFISYARIDVDFARRLHGVLTTLGATAWLDVKDIPVGANWSSAIQHGLDSCELMLLLLTPEAMSSENVSNEWQYFIDEKKPIIPILLRDSKLHFQLRRMQYVDFRMRSFDVALVDLHGALGRNGVHLKPLALPPIRPTATPVLIKPEGNQTAYVEAIERYIRDTLRLDPMKTRINVPNGDGWIYDFDSAIIEIYLTKDVEDWMLNCISLLANVPARGVTKITAELLKLNLSITNSAFGIYQDGIYLYQDSPLSEIPLATLPKKLNRFGGYANEFSKMLFKQFGLRRHKV